MKASIIVANNIAGWSFPKRVLSTGLEAIVVNSLNPSWARNEGAKRAKGKYLVFLDNDVAVKPGFLDKVIVYLDQHPKVGAGQLKLLRWGSNRYDSAGDLLTGWGFWQNGRGKRPIKASLTRRIKFFRQRRGDDREKKCFYKN